MEEEKNVVAETKAEDESDFGAAIEEKLNKVQEKAMLWGAKATCTVIIGKINRAKNKRSKMSFRDYERLVKEITTFCETGISGDPNNGEEPEVDTTKL